MLIPYNRPANKLWKKKEGWNLFANTSFFSLELMAMASGWGARHAVYCYESVTTMVERNNIVAQQAFTAQPSQSDAASAARLNDWLPSRNGMPLHGRGFGRTHKHPRVQDWWATLSLEIYRPIFRGWSWGENEEQERKVVRRVLMPKIAKRVSIMRM
jgi:hypothetical protein